MRKTKGNKGLLDRRRFESLEREKECWLRGLSQKKAIRLEEKMMSSPLIIELGLNLRQDHPICLKKSLELMRRAAQKRRRVAIKKGTSN